MAEPKQDYAALAEFLSTWPDAFTLKRFRELQVKNLLFYQAELAHLHSELHEAEVRDAKEDAKRLPHLQQHVSKWPRRLAEGAIPGPTKTPISMYIDKMLKIRETLKVYSESPASSANSVSKTSSYADWNSR